jgi:catechol 1,2-dioxygenase
MRTHKRETSQGILSEGHVPLTLRQLEIVMEGDRLKTILLDLEQTLLDFIDRHNINHEDYRKATDLMVATVKEGEESLLPDVFFEAATTNIGNIGREGSGEAIEGPFYFPGSPRIDNPGQLPHRADEAGDVLFFNGRVTSTDGKPVAGAVVDLWHADAKGLYSLIHPGIPDWNLRGHLVTDEDGRYEFQTILPPPYEIPKNGPTGRVLTALGRHFFRPAHLHVKVRHPDFGEMTSQLYFQGGEYLDSDVANAVREDLVLHLVRHDKETDFAARGLNGPFFEVTYDFVLAPSKL